MPIITRSRPALLTLALALSAALAFRGEAAPEPAPDHFINATAGFELTKPKDWHYATAEQNLENLKKVHFDSPEFAEAVSKYAAAPLVIITKFEEPYDDLNPSLKVNLRPLGEFKGKRPEDILTAILPQLKRAFKDYELVQAPTETKVAGITAGYARVHYTMTIPDGRTFPTASELWIVPRGEHFFMIGAGTRQDEKTGTRADTKAIIDTIKIVQ